MKHSDYLHCVHTHAIIVIVAVVSCVLLIVGVLGCVSSVGMAVHVIHMRRRSNKTEAARDFKQVSVNFMLHPSNNLLQILKQQFLIFCPSMDPEIWHRHG